MDPDLACAHHFYTQIQLDLGESRAAAVRLVQRLVARGDEPESFAGLVQALRYCGLLEESVAAHVRATALDPAVATSVTHTHFLRGDYHSSLDTYVGTRYYLDAAAWAALGDGNRAMALLEKRLEAGSLSPQMESLMRSLLAILEGRHDDAIATMAAIQIEREPEAVFYLARQYALAGASTDAVRLIRRARQEGLTSSTALRHDRAFRRLWKDAAFLRERREAERLERSIRRELEHAAGGRLNSLLAGATESRRTL